MYGHTVVWIDDLLYTIRKTMLQGCRISQSVINNSPFMTKDHLSFYPSVLRITSFTSYHHCTYSVHRSEAYVWTLCCMDTLSPRHTGFTIYCTQFEKVCCKNVYQMSHITSHRYNAISLAMPPVETFQPFTHTEYTTLEHNVHTSISVNIVNLLYI